MSTFMRSSTWMLAFALLAAAYGPATQAAAQKAKLAKAEFVLGSGLAKTEHRAVTAFRGVKLRGVGTLYVEQNGKDSVQITADDNVLPYLSAVLEDGILILGPKPGVFLQPRLAIVYQVTARSLEVLAAHGSGSIDAKGLQTQSLEVALGGSGHLRVAGRAEQQSMKLFGAWNVDATDLRGRKADVNLNGSGNAHVNVSDQLRARVQGSGQVYYAGAPKLDQGIAGTGAVLPSSTAARESLGL